MRKKSNINLPKKIMIYLLSGVMTFSTVSGSVGTITAFAAEDEEEPSGGDSGSSDKGDAGSPDKGNSGSEKSDSGEKSEKSGSEAVHDVGSVEHTYEVRAEQADSDRKDMEQAVSEAQKAVEGATAEAQEKLDEAQKSLENLEHTLGVEYDEETGTYENTSLENEVDTTEGNSWMKTNVETMKTNLAELEKNDGSGKAEGAIADAKQAIESAEAAKEIAQEAIDIDYNAYEDKEQFRLDMQEKLDEIHEYVTDANENYQAAKTELTDAQTQLKKAINAYNEYVKGYNNGKPEAQQIPTISLSTSASSFGSAELRELSAFFEALEGMGDAVDTAQQAVEDAQTAADALEISKEAALEAKTYAEELLTVANETLEKEGLELIEAPENEDLEKVHQENEAELARIQEKKQETDQLMDTVAAIDTKEIQEKIDTLSEKSQALEEKYEQEQKLLEERVQSMVDSFAKEGSLAEFKKRLLQAQQRVDEAKKALDEAKAAVEMAKQYEQWTTFLKGYDPENKSYALGLYGQLEDSSNKNKVAYSSDKTMKGTNDLAFDLENSEVVSRNTKYFATLVSVMKAEVAAPYELLQEYIKYIAEQGYTFDSAKVDQAVAGGKKTFSTQSSKLIGKGIATTTENSDAIVLWEYDETKKPGEALTGSKLLWQNDDDSLYEWAIANGKKPGDVVTFFVGYTFKLEDDGFHIDGVLSKIEIPYPMGEIVKEEPGPGDDPKKDDPKENDGGKEKSHHRSGGERVEGDVLGARREEQEAAVLTTEDGRVLGASRAPKTSDQSRAILWMLVMGCSMGTALLMMRKKSVR